MTLVFVDTNVLIYNEDGANQAKRNIAHQLTIESTFRIESRYGLSYWDSLCCQYQPVGPTNCSASMPEAKAF